MNILLLITFLLILIITIFAMQNGIPLDVKFLFWEFKSSLIAVIFGSTFIGAGIVAALTIPKLIQKHFRERNLGKQVHTLERKTLELEKRLTE
ncbi:MAG: LapA family protein [Thermodesulfobacteriota bacterium]|nr:LapA family protein [Thermodesulfobacteriota bacterium]